MDSSESDEDDYFPDGTHMKPLRRVNKNKTWLPSNETARIRPPIRDSRAGIRLTRSNSEANPIAVVDIMSDNPCKLRKNSCDCQACGGEKLAKRILFTAIPMREIQRKVVRRSSINTLNALIRGCRSGSFLMPIIGKYRLSALIKPVPNQVFVSPPATPNLSRFLASLTPRPAVKKTKGKLQFRATVTATTCSSPIHQAGFEESSSDMRLPKSRGPVRTTPFHTNSERKGGNATRSLGVSQSEGRLQIDKWSTRPRNVF